jgi:hypothetical protein
MTTEWRFSDQNSKVSMSIRIGTILLGSVDSAHGESIQSKFFVLILPLFPVGSYHMLEGGGAIKIKAHGKSILTGYLTFLGSIAALLLFVFGLIAFIHKITPNRTLGAAMMAGATALGVLVWWINTKWSNIHPDEADTRMRLKSVLGAGVHPGRLKKKELGTLYQALQERLRAEQLPLECEALFKVGLQPEQVPLVYCACLYGRYAEPSANWGTLEASLRPHLT